MRFINIRHLPREADLTAIEDACIEIAELDEDARGEYIDEHPDKWTYLREALWRIGYMKCWYSEAILQAREGQVEHFRPKKRLSGARHSGYWWRAFDWMNLRLAHPTVNIRREDYLTREQAGKGSYFPLCDEAKRATTPRDEPDESPLLLDPVDSKDCKLLCFDSSNGRPIPRYSEEEDELKFKRAKASIDFYHLKEGTWNYKRKDLMDDVSVLCDRIIEAKSNANQAESNTLMQTLISEFIDPRAEFSSAALQIVHEKGLLEETIT